MWFGSKKKHASLTVVMLAIILVFGATPGAQADDEAIERLRITVGDTVGPAGAQNSVVTVFLTNTMDHIAFFSLHLVLTRSDIANFQTNFTMLTDTTYWLCIQEESGVCVDSIGVDDPDDPETPWDIMHIGETEVSIGNFDTVGTLISGWELVTARAVSTGDLGLDILLTAWSDKASVPGYVPPIAPQGGGVLFRLLADIFPIPDEQEDRSVSIDIDVSWKPYFSFSTAAGESIGWVTVQVADTNFYVCTNPIPPPGSGCAGWTKVPESLCPEGGCDSIAIGTVDVAVLDETAVRLQNGSITVMAGGCGDVNGDGNITIGDIALMIDHLFIGNAPIVPIEPGNVNCSTEQPVVLTIGDISVLIDRLFITQQPMCCE